MTTGREAYEADCARRPLYHDGKPRKTWDQLGTIERSSWELPATEPTPAGNQFIIPGCEKDKTRGPTQADLF